MIRKIMRTVQKGMCELCKEERDKDILYMGPGVASFIFFPCRHSVHYSNGKADIWVDENNNTHDIMPSKVDVDTIDFDKVKKDKDLLLKKFLAAKNKAEQNNMVRSIKLD